MFNISSEDNNRGIDLIQFPMEISMNILNILRFPLPNYELRHQLWKVLIPSNVTLDKGISHIYYYINSISFNIYYNRCQFIRLST